VYYGTSSYPAGALMLFVSEIILFWLLT
jgi:hypothetical protein